MREIAPFGIRMPPDLKRELLDRARAAGRSLNQELLVRLRASLAGDIAAGLRDGYTVEEPRSVYTSSVSTSEAERLLLIEFRQLPADKQLALLALIK